MTDEETTDTDEIGPPLRLGTEQLSQLARDIVTNRVFITNDSEGIDNSFSLILSGSAPRMTDDTINQIGAVYEYIDKAADRSINGYPFFFSCKMLHRDDLRPLVAEVERM